MRFLDFFSGIGGFRLGFEQAGHECVGHVEWDKYAQQSYKAMHSYGREEDYEREYCGWDITDTRADELPRADIWNFGAPCQDFSIAGKRNGLEGERSSLIREVFRLVRDTPEENKPRYLIYENVKGMLSSNRGRDFLAILIEMGELGYDLEWQTLNSKNYGVPQNRERVFVIGHLRGRSGRKVFPIGGTDSKIDVKCLGHRKGYNQNTTIWDLDGLCGTLDTSQGGGRQPHIAVQMNRNRIKGPTNTSHSLMARDFKGFGNQDMTGVIIRKPRISKPTHNLRVFVREATTTGYAIAEQGDSINLEQPNSKTRRGRVGKGVANTLTTNCNQGVVASGIYLNTSVRYNRGPLIGLSRTLKANSHDAGVTNGIRIRKLTPLECWRLQGFPDEYFYRAKASGVSNSQLYKQAGNSVTVNVIYEIARRITQ